MFHSEINILGLYGVYVCLVLLAQASGAATQFDMGYLLSSRDEKRSLSGMIARLGRALNNSIIALALFAPAILILQTKSAFDPYTLMAAQVFLVARIIYVPAYVFNLVGLRTLLWLVGFATTVVLYLMAY